MLDDIWEPYGFNIANWGYDRDAFYDGESEKIPLNDWDKHLELREKRDADLLLADMISASEWWAVVRAYINKQHLFGYVMPYNKNVALHHYGENEEIYFVYFLIDAKGDLLYVGKTNSITTRIGAHKSTGVIPFCKVIYIAYRDYYGYAVVLDVEREFISLFNPPYNKAYGSRVDNDNDTYEWKVSIAISGPKDVVIANRLFFDSLDVWLDCNHEDAAKQLFLAGLNSVIEDSGYMDFGKKPKRRWKWQKLSDDPLAKMEKHKYTMELNWEI